MEAMWFYDEAEDLEQWHALRKAAQEVEQQYLELRVSLRDAEAALRVDPGNRDLGFRVEELKSRLAELDRQVPWISSDVPLEILLWGAPHG